MTPIRKTVRVHHKTVSEANKHVKKRRSPSPAETVTIDNLKINAMVWQTAMRLAGGDSTRIVDRKPDSVVVSNKSKRKPKGIL